MCITAPLKVHVPGQTGNQLVHGQGMQFVDTLTDWSTEMPEPVIGPALSSVRIKTFCNFVTEWSPEYCTQTM